jgi:hypothetical protein
MEINLGKTKVMKISRRQCQAQIKVGQKQQQNVEYLTLRLLMSYIYGAPILDASRSHTATQHSRQDASGRVISSSQRPLPDNTRHSQQTNIHAPGGIRTHDLSR